MSFDSLLNSSATLYRPTAVDDTLGGRTQEWTALGTFGCRVMALGIAVWIGVRVPVAGGATPPKVPAALGADPGFGGDGAPGVSQGGQERPPRLG